MQYTEENDGKMEDLRLIPRRSPLVNKKIHTDNLTDLYNRKSAPENSARLPGLEPLN
jgi:hypothetical protein